MQMVLAASSRELKWKITAHGINDFIFSRKKKGSSGNDNLNRIKYMIIGWLTSIHHPFFSGMCGLCSHCNFVVALGRGARVNLVICCVFRRLSVPKKNEKEINNEKCSSFV